jgi:hypothetical protein
LGIRRILDAYSGEGLVISSVRKGEGDRGNQQGTAFPRLCARLRRLGDPFTGAGCGIPAIPSDEELAIELLTAKSASLHPGNFYDFPSDGFLVASQPQRPRGTDYAQWMSNALILLR